MRAVVQRVKSARVLVHTAQTNSDELVGQIEHGLLVYLGIGDGDGDAEIAWLAKKILALRIFEDRSAPPKLNLSLLDVGASVLVVSQFTLYADVSRGNRPSFGKAAAPALAEVLYERFVAAIRQHAPTQTGRFRADMRVESVGYGPITIWFDTEKDQPRRGVVEDAASRFVDTLRGTDE